MNRISCEGMLLSFHNTLNTLLEEGSVLDDYEVFFFIYCLYVDLVEKLPEGARIQIGIDVFIMSIHLTKMNLLYSFRHMDWKYF